MYKISENNIRYIAILVLSAILLVALLCFSGCVDASALSLAVVFPTVTGSKIVSGEPLTTAIADEHSPSFLQNEIDERIVKIRPMSTPVDQISRYKGARKSGSMIVDYYSVDMKPTSTYVSASYLEPNEENVTAAHTRAKLFVELSDAFETSDTIMLQDVKGFDTDGVNRTDVSLILYVMGKDTDTGALLVTPVNGKRIGDVMGCVPNIQVGCKVIRMGRAATELDVQTAQFESLPIKSQNFCQIFKMQIEQSTFMKIANKEVEWDFSDQEEAAIYDMRLSMEKSFLFGLKSSIYDPLKKENVSLTGGIWWQAGKQFDYEPNVSWTQDQLVDMMQECFTGNAGNKRKVLIAGSSLISCLNKMDAYKTFSNENTMVKWGLDFNEVVSKFGKLYVIHSEIFDDCGKSGCGIVIDPEYLQKWSHVPFGSQALDLKKAGIRNTDALVLTEASCMTLRYPNAHMRIVPLY